LVSQLTATRVPGHRHSGRSSAPVLSRFATSVAPHASRVALRRYFCRSHCHSHRHSPPVLSSRSSLPVLSPIHRNSCRCIAKVSLLERCHTPWGVTRSVTRPTKSVTGEAKSVTRRAESVTRASSHYHRIKKSPWRPLQPCCADRF